MLGEYSAMTLGIKMFDAGFGSTRQQGYSSGISMMLLDLNNH